jgi:hypothetical protein
MPTILLALLTVGAFGMAGAALAQTGIQYPFCIQGLDNPGYSGCSFNSFQECQASAAGTDAECISNPWYKASNDEPTGQGGVATTAPNAAIPVGPPPFTPGN